MHHSLVCRGLYTRACVSVLFLFRRKEGRVQCDPPCVPVMCLFLMPMLVLLQSACVYVRCMLCHGVPLTVSTPAAAADALIQAHDGAKADAGTGVWISFAASCFPSTAGMHIHGAIHSHPLASRASTHAFRLTGDAVPAALATPPADACFPPCLLFSRSPLVLP